jgi:hypothetical protein
MHQYKCDYMIWDGLEKRSVYFFGVGVGLLISWVTTSLAYIRSPSDALLYLAILEFVASVVLILVAFLANTQGKKTGRKSG